MFEIIAFQKIKTWLYFFSLSLLNKLPKKRIARTRMYIIRNLWYCIIPKMHLIYKMILGVKDNVINIWIYFQNIFLIKSYYIYSLLITINVYFLLILINQITFNFIITHCLLQEHHNVICFMKGSFIFLHKVKRQWWVGYDSCTLYGPSWAGYNIITLLCLE